MDTHQQDKSLKAKNFKQTLQEQNSQVLRTLNPYTKWLPGKMEKSNITVEKADKRSLRQVIRVIIHLLSQAGRHPWQKVMKSTPYPSNYPLKLFIITRKTPEQQSSKMSKLFSMTAGLSRQIPQTGLNNRNFLHSFGAYMFNIKASAVFPLF